MPGQKCCICGNSQVLDKTASFHRFPDDKARRAVWLEVFDVREEDLKPSSRVCSRHFPGGNSKKKPSLNIGTVVCLNQYQQYVSLRIGPLITCYGVFH